jgi:phospholipid-translocating ATPase
MEFRQASINGNVYGLIKASSEHGNNEIYLKEKRDLMKLRLRDIFDIKYFDDECSFIDPKLPQDLLSNQEQAVKIREFFTLLAICHSVIIDESTDNIKENPKYQAKSPDEEALVRTAANLGFVFAQKAINQIQVEILGEKAIFTILNVLEFNSERKRMSVIVQTQQNDILLLCKGADCAISSILSQKTEKSKIEQTSRHLSEFANSGFRTLYIAQKKISRDDYLEWNSKYQIAQSSKIDRDKKCKILEESIEKDLYLLGATAVEDNLQPGVPECIENLALAGIKLWVLTV